MVWWRPGRLREPVYMSNPDKWSAKRRVRVAGALAVASMAGAACHQAMNRGTEQSAVASAFVERAKVARPAFTTCFYNRIDHLFFGNFTFYKINRYHTTFKIYF